MKNLFFARWKLTNEPGLWLGSIVADFCGSAMGMAWMYRESFLYHWFHLFAPIIILIHFFLLFSLFQDILSEKVSKNKVNKFLCIVLFIFQVIVTIGVFIPLILIFFNVWT